MYNLNGMSLDKLCVRALAAYYESGGDELPTAATIERIDPHDYVVLRRGAKVIACYRIRNDGKLKRLLRLPREIRTAT